MALFDQIFGTQVTNLSNALGRTSQRHSLLTKNLANVNTPGYKRQDVDFGIELQRADDRMSVRLSNLTGLSGRQLAMAVRQNRSERLGEVQTDKSSVRVDGSSVDLESEVSAMAETELRYQALSDMTANYFSQMKSVIRGGN